MTETLLSAETSVKTPNSRFYHKVTIRMLSSSQWLKIHFFLWIKSYHNGSLINELDSINKFIYTKNENCHSWWSFGRVKCQLNDLKCFCNSHAAFIIFGFCHFCDWNIQTSFCNLKIMLNRFEVRYEVLLGLWNRLSPQGGALANSYLSY